MKYVIFLFLAIIFLIIILFIYSALVLASRYDDEMDNEYDMSFRK